MSSAWQGSRTSPVAVIASTRAPPPLLQLRCHANTYHHAVTRFPVAVSSLSSKINRLNLLLKAQVVCATLSGAGSQYLVESVLLHAHELAKQKSKGGPRLGAVTSEVLGFDAVVMVGPVHSCAIAFPVLLNAVIFGCR